MTVGRGTWISQDKNSGSVCGYCAMLFYQDKNRAIPSLGNVTAVGLAFGLAVRPRVVAAAAAAGGLVRPVPADVVAVHPDLALTHAAHVQGHRSVAGRRVEVGLIKSSRVQ